MVHFDITMRVSILKSCAYLRRIHVFKPQRLSSYAQVPVKCPSYSSLSDTGDQYDVVIAGAGPCGLSLFNLLVPNGMRVLLLEQKSRLSSHPQAHFINNRSMEIFRQIGVEKQILAQSPPLSHWRRFVYCRNFSLDGLLGEVDHFHDYGKSNHSYSSTHVCHLPQPLLLKILHENAKNLLHQRTIEQHVDSCQSKIVFGETVQNVKVVDGQKVQIETSSSKKICSNYFVAADGAHSIIRSHLQIPLRNSGPQEHDQNNQQTSTPKTLQHLINVHFFWPSAGEFLLQNHHNNDEGKSAHNNGSSIGPAMIYFVFNEHIIGAVVAHDLTKGEFVAQIPFFPPIEAEEHFTKDRVSRMLSALVPKNSRNMHDLNICQIGSWEMFSCVADQYFGATQRVFLAGDAAHQFTPAGGFGMNTGIQDVHNLAWKLRLMVHHRRQSMVHECEQQELEHVLAVSYTNERKQIALYNSNLSYHNWLQALQVPEALGLYTQAAEAFTNVASGLVSFLPRHFVAQGFGAGMALAKSIVSTPALREIQQKRLDNIFSPTSGGGSTLRLLFPQDDLGFVYGSNCRSLTKNLQQLILAGGRLPNAELQVYSSSSECTHSANVKTTMTTHDFITMQQQNQGEENIAPTMCVFITVHCEHNDPLRILTAISKVCCGTHAVIKNRVPVALMCVLTGDHSKSVAKNITAVTTDECVSKDFKYWQCHESFKDISIATDSTRAWQASLSFTELNDLDISTESSIHCIMCRPDGHIAKIRAMSLDASNIQWSSDKESLWNLLCGNGHKYE